MSINSEDIVKTNKYFKVSSGYVPNQFSVRVIKKGVVNQEAGFILPNNPLYLLNLEPWVIEELTLPQIRFNMSNDLYMDSDTLIKPDYITSVVTTGKLEIKVREKSDLAIHRSLIRCQQELYRSSYEGTGSLGEDYSLEVRIKSQRFDDNAANGDNVFGDNFLVFGRAILTEISNPTFSYGDKKFLRYSVTFDVNCMAETYRLDKITTMKVFKNNITSTIGNRTIKNNSLYNKDKVAEPSTGGKILGTVAGTLMGGPLGGLVMGDAIGNIIDAGTKSVKDFITPSLPSTKTDFPAKKSNVPLLDL